MSLWRSDKILGFFSALRMTAETPRYCGVSVRVCLVAALTAAVENGMGKVVPLYQAGHWSRNQGLAGLPDSPSTRLRVELSRLERSAVKRSEGPKVRLTCFTVLVS